MKDSQGNEGELAQFAEKEIELEAQEARIDVQKKRLEDER